MFQHIIVPVDGSERSWVAARIGSVIARACGADLELLTVVFDARECDRAKHDLERGLEEQPPFDVDPQLQVVAARASDDTVGTVVARRGETVLGAMIVMSSTGRGRSAAVLGNVADEIVRQMFGPIIVIGPHVRTFESFSGDIIVPVDGSEFSETSLPLAGSWGIALGATPWVVEVLTEPTPSSADVFESSYPHRLASGLASQTHHEVEFEVLHGPSAAHAIADYATKTDARLIIMSTHGRTGMKRFTAGSTASSVVHEATCPVVLHRPPAFAVGGQG